MPLIKLTTFVKAPLERVFDLSRSIDLHKYSMNRFEEKPVAGRLTGLIEAGEEVTWKARHLLKERTLRVKITAMEHGVSFTDEMLAGDFRSMKHDHFFKACDNGTFMIDHFAFESPYGTLGRWFNSLYLAGYMKRMLEERNTIIRQVAESNQWKQYLVNTPA